MSEEKLASASDSNSLNSSREPLKEFPEHHLELKHHTSADVEASGNWYDKKRLGARYSDAMIQVVLLGFVCFMTSGMFNALTGVGAPISDVSTSDNANVALYCTFASIGFFGGTICNIIGVRYALMFGGTGYAIYAGSLLCYVRVQNSGFVIFAGAFLGICAAVLWSAQGAILMSYPTEGAKGRAIIVFWVIFNLGAVIGSLISLGNSINSQSSTANEGTYIAFIVLMCSGSIIAFFMLPMSKVWKADHTKVIGQKHPNWKEELIALGKLLLSEKRILFLFPMFFASNWFYAYQFNDFNAGRFNLRTRSLNSLLYWLSQMVGALVIGYILDMPWYKRRTRAKIGWVIVFVLGMSIWGGGLAFEKQFTREDVTAGPNGEPPLLAPIDYKDGKYIGPMFLYIFYGVYDAVYQSFILWTLGAMSNNPKKTALYAGFYKGIQSAGAAVSWRLDAIKKPYLDLFASSWGLSVGGMVLALPIYILYIKDHTDVEEDDLAQVLDQEIEVVKSKPEHVE
jgi:MFS family permease